MGTGKSIHTKNPLEQIGPTHGNTGIPGRISFSNKLPMLPSLPLFFRRLTILGKDVLSGHFELPANKPW